MSHFYMLIHYMHHSLINKIANNIKGNFYVYNEISK